MIKLFFCQHAKIGEATALGTEGIAETLSVDTILQDLGFETQYAFSSPAEPCVETALLFSPVVMQEVPILRNFGTSKELKNLADEFLAPIEAANLPEDAQAVVVSHDCVPTIMAWRWLERHGAKVDWNIPEPLDNLRESCGFLVEGTECRYITPIGETKITP